MTLPTPPVTTTGEKLHYLTDNNAGTNRANVWLGLNSTTLNGERVAHAAVASHILGAAITYPGDPVMMIGVYDNSGNVESPGMSALGGLWVSHVSDVAHDVADTGPPLKIGGKAVNNVPTSVTNGDRADAWFGLSGQLMVGFGLNASIADGMSSTSLLRPKGASGTDSTLVVHGTVYNGSTYDRMYGTAANGVDVDVTRMPKATTAALTNVASSATNVTILASNANRIGATVFNDSTQILYLKFGATASATSHTIQILAGGYYEVPFGYSGILDGLWASANGNARVTEVTA